MHRAQRHGTKHRRRRKELLSSVKGVCHLSRRAKRRLYCKLQLWVWRKRRENCRFAFVRGRRAVNVKTQKNRRRVPACCAAGLECSQVKTSDGSASALRGPTCLPMPSESSLNASLTSVASPAAPGQTRPAATAPPRRVESFVEVADPSEISASARPLPSDADACGSIDKERAVAAAPRPVGNGPSGQHATLPQVRRRDGDSDMNITSRTTKSSTSDVGVECMVKDIHEFLSDFYRAYGSFIPLQKSDVLKHLRRKLNCDLNGRKNLIFAEVIKYRAASMLKPIPSFRVVFKKHTLTLDDLSTLADQNWLNDQVMNMYGELMMEAAQNKVHFLNSFFHRQLMTKGYDGVKRWTKQIDLFSKSLLLVPIHLEVHWCLVTADIVKKKICLYDSQGNALHKVARNILKYLMAEAKAKQQPAFESGWSVSFSETIPQQTNENDCGVFVLEYSRCLALAQPLNFSQEDIPKIRKRIYKELCHCRLLEHG